MGNIKRVKTDTRKTVTEMSSAIAWLEVILLAALAPIFIFPTQNRAVLFLIFPILWIFRWIRKNGRTRDTEARTAIDLSILVLILQLFLSTLRSGEILTSLPKISGILYGILTFYGLVRLLKKEPLIKFGIGVFMVGSLALSSIGLMGLARTNEPLFDKTVDFILKNVPHINLRFQGAEPGINPNALAGVMLFFIPLSIVYAVQGMKKNSGKFLVSKLMDTIFFSSLSLYFVLVLFLTKSIASWMALAIGLWFVIPSWKVKAVGSALPIILVIIVLFLLPAKYEKTAQGDEIPFWKTKIEARYMWWQAGLEAVNDEPLFGIGVNQLRMRPGFNYTFSHAHNQMLHTAAELGIPGLMAYMAILIGAGFLCMQIWKKASAGWMRAAAQGLGAGQVAHFIFGLGDSLPLGTKPGIFFWVSLALIVSLYNFSMKDNLHPH